MTLPILFCQEALGIHGNNDIRSKHQTRNSNSEDDTENLTEKRRQETQFTVFPHKRADAANKEQTCDEKPSHSDDNVNKIENVDSFDGVDKILAIGVDICVGEDLGKNGLGALVIISPCQDSSTGAIRVILYLMCGG